MKTVAVLFFVSLLNFNTEFGLINNRIKESDYNFQTPAYCFIHTANMNKGAYVSSVLDPIDFSSGSWDTQKIIIKSAAKAALNKQVGNSAWEYTLGLTIEDKNNSGVIFSNK